MSTTNIQWTQNDDGTPGKTWNPVRGCSRVSPGCDNCYAMRQAHRFDTPSPRSPYHGLTTIRRGKVDWTGMARLIPEQLGAPLKWRKPQRVFVNSMSDLFHESLSNEEIAAVFGVMAACPQHTFQILTKRPERAKKWFKWVVSECEKHQGCERDTLHHALYGYMPDDASDYRGPRWQPNFFDQYEVHASSPGSSGARWPLPNVWLGVSVENQKTADERIPLLLELPAAVRFISAEPLLGPVDFDLPRCDTHDREFVKNGDDGEYCEECAADGFSGEMSYGHWLDPIDEEGPLNGGVNWVIVGGESGNGARSFNLAWARDIVAQCETANVPVFVKQLGAVPMADATWWCSPAGHASMTRPAPEAHQSEAQRKAGLVRIAMVDRAGGDMAEWPAELRVRQFPESR